MNLKARAVTYTLLQ